MTRIPIKEFDKKVELPVWIGELLKAANGALYLLTSGTNGRALTYPPRLDEIGHADVISTLQAALAKAEGR